MTAVPRLSRQSAPARAGIVHLGPGAFFKAFVGTYTDDVLRAQGGDWGIIAVSLKSDRAARELLPQGGVYTSITRGPGDPAPQVIEATSDVIVAPEDPARVTATLADPGIKIVSLTITEKGYCRNPATGELDTDLEGIKADLKHPERPETAIGIIVQGLALRRAAGAVPFTVLSCDNLPDNGATTRRIVLEFARRRDPALADWIAAQARFPATMVDRITPATTDADISALSALKGYQDLACVVHEPFRQWVIEDDFVGGIRPDWDIAGAQFVGSVAAHETLKLRCLNGTHSALAYLGYLAGYETIAQTVADPAFATLCEKLWSDEILPTVARPEGENLDLYTAALLERYRNACIQHRTWQIAMDGSQKLPQRLLNTIRDRLVQGHLPAGLCLAVAAWMRYVGGQDENGGVIDVRDPLAASLKAASDSARDPEGKVAALLGFKAVFPDDLVRDDRFVADVTAAYIALAKQGARKTVLSYVASA